MLLPDQLHLGPRTLDFVKVRLKLGDAFELDVEVLRVLSKRVEDFSELVTAHIHGAVGRPRTATTTLGRHWLLPFALRFEAMNSKQYNGVGDFTTPERTTAPVLLPNQTLNKCV